MQAKPILRLTAACTLAIMTLSGGMAVAQDRRDDHSDNHQYVRHNEWRKGQHIQHADWNRGDRVDYRRYHLQAPPRGYEWREVDGNYVMAAVATGLIASVVAAAATH